MFCLASPVRCTDVSCRIAFGYPADLYDRHAPPRRWEVESHCEPLLGEAMVLADVVVQGRRRRLSFAGGPLHIDQENTRMSLKSTQLSASGISRAGPLEICGPVAA